MASVELDRPQHVIAELSASEKAYRWAASCARSVGRILLGRKGRGRARVTNEYHAGRWKQVFDDKSWRNDAGIEQFLTGSNPQQIIVRLDGRMCRMTHRDYYAYRIDALRKTLGSWLDLDSQIVELGSGFGYNVFSLAYVSPCVRVQGFDISENGIAAAREIARHYRLDDRVSFDHLDLTDASHPNWAQVRGQGVYTFFCLEQIPYDIEKVLRNILSAGPSMVVHAEPGMDQLRWSKLSDWPNLLYVISMSYQTSLTRCLRKLEKEGVIELLHLGRLSFSPTIQNDGFVAAWRPRTGGG